jgi:deoxyribose-phosphate aldolase
VIAFPHGNSTTEVKVFEAIKAVYEGGTEIDMVVNIGRVLSEKWEYVSHEIRSINEAVVERGAILKVIFENDCEYIAFCFLCSPLFEVDVHPTKMLKQMNEVRDHAHTI